MKQDLLNALRLVKDYCERTMCSKCEIKNNCDKNNDNYGIPKCWVLEESEDK